MKNIKDNNKSKARIFGTMLIAILVVATSFTVLFLVPQSPLSMNPASAAVVDDYLYSKQITIDHTKVAGDESNFPVWVYDTSANFADNILASGADIAFFDSTKTTRFNHEAETWVKGTGELGVWVNVTSVSDSVNTVFYIYYGDSDTGDSVNHNPESVWDGNFAMVQHMYDNTTSDIVDSTAGIIGTKNATNTPVQVAGKMGYSENYDNNGDYINLSGEYIPRGAKTLGCWMKSGTNWGVLFDNSGGSAATYGSYLGTNSDGTLNFKVCKGEAPLTFDITTVGIDYGDSSWHYVVATWDGTTDVDKAIIYVDGVSKITGTAVATESHAPDKPDYIGDSYGGVADYCFDGSIDEVRFSSSVRSANWINTSFLNQNDVSSFLTFGSQSGDETSSELKGLTDGRITFSGTAGNVIYCNSSGTNNEWPEINMSINASTNYTELRVWMDDFNDTGAYINTSNITMYVSSDNSSYGQLGTFPDGGGNCTYAINATNWNAGTMGADPFAGAGLTNKTVSIWVIFKVAIPSDTPTDEFWSGAIDSFKIYLGHYS